MLGTLWLAHQLRPATGGLLSSLQARAFGPAATVGVLAWLAERSLDPRRSGVTFATVAGLSLVGLAVYGGALRLLNALPTRAPAPHIAGLAT